VHVIVISGLSGAGKTVALRALEDCGFFCIDNLPVALIESFISTVRSGKNISKIGIGIDIREKEFLSGAYNILAGLKAEHKTDILFFEAEKEVMVRRYKETRRPHPMIVSGLLAGNGKSSIETAIDKEKALLSVIRDAADRVIDTSNYTPHQLRHFMMSAYGDAETQGMNISVISFGYKFGAPQSLDLLFDVRFLPNPYFIPELKPLKGIDAPVSDFVLKHEETKDFLGRLSSFLDFLIPLYIREGRAYLSIGIGCTGGMHRSPALVQEIAKHIQQRHEIKPNVVHRDMA
jgi:UPF0042 nucleotide-binding protein